MEYGKQYNVEVFFPKLEVDGTYEVNGQVLLLPIKGSGPFHGTFCKIQLISVEKKPSSPHFCLSKSYYYIMQNTQK